jgi:beta-lactamase superfamily II metal-dependent hydrolase
MDKLRVRVYAVRFGDGILISVPDRAANGTVETRHILLDVGNAYRSRITGGTGHEDVAFDPVVKDIVSELGGQPLDLYIMTHEHYDHVQGLPYAQEKVFPDQDLQKTLQVQYAWLSGSAKPSYYDTHPQAKKQKLALERAYLDIDRFLEAAPQHQDPYVEALMQINSRYLTKALGLRSTASCVDYLRALAAEEHTFYIHRPRAAHPEDSLEGKHPFHEARLSIWAPEEDTAVYYRKIQPMPLGMARPGSKRAKPKLTQAVPPSGVDAGAFYNLVDTRRRTFLDNLLAIDHAANNTSVVLLVEWRGWKLLFTADAEHKSWKIMNDLDEMLRKESKKLFEAVHFLKVSHHGSDTGMPPTEPLEKILPGASQTAPDGKQRHAVISTYPQTYPGVPDRELLVAELEPRCQLHYTDALKDGGWIDFEFEGHGGGVTVTTNA